MDILKILKELNKINTKNKKDYTEEELEVYGLTDKEKDLVRKGLHNPWDFEEDGKLDDDDYYNKK